VCIGALVAHRESGHWAVDALGAPYVGERTEKQLIAFRNTPIEQRTTMERWLPVVGDTKVRGIE
jgi:hypothetical protein